MSTVARWFTEADVAACMDMREAITAVREALRDEATGGAHTMAKAHTDWEVDGAYGGLHAVGAAMPAIGLVGTKTWAHTPGGAAPLLILFDSRTGAVRAVIEAFALGQLRTGAMSGVATDLLAAADATEMTVIGTGKQALAQVAAVAAVRPIERVRVCGRDPGRAQAFADRVERELGLAARIAPDVDDAVHDVPIITLVTRATTPVLTADAPATGTHVNAVGAITPERAEFEPALLSRCASVTADSIEQARALSWELRDYYGTDETGWAPVRRLCDVVAADTGRPDGADVTLFKSLGIGLADVAMGARCLALAEERGLGTALPARVRSSPRLSSADRPKPSASQPSSPAPESVQ